MATIRTCDDCKKPVLSGEPNTCYFASFPLQHIRATGGYFKVRCAGSSRDLDLCRECHHKALETFTAMVRQAVAKDREAQSSGSDSLVSDGEIQKQPLDPSESSL